MRYLERTDTQHRVGDLTWVLLGGKKGKVMAVIEDIYSMGTNLGTTITIVNSGQRILQIAFKHLRQTKKNKQKYSERAKKPPIPLRTCGRWAKVTGQLK